MIHGILSRGILYSLGTAINRVVPAAWFRFRIFRVYQLKSPVEANRVGAESNRHFRWCESKDDYRLAAQLTYFDLNDDQDGGTMEYRACLAIEAGEPIGGLWRATTRFDEQELGVRIVLDDDQAWAFAATIAKRHRGRGVYRDLLAHVISCDPERKHFVSINPTNRASIAAHRKFIQTTVGTCVSCRLFKVAISFAGGGLMLDHNVSFSCYKQPLQLRFGVEDPAG